MTNLQAAIAAHRALVERVKQAFPDEASEDLADSIDSATELDQAIVAALRMMQEEEAHVAAIAEMMNRLGERKKRKQDRIEAIRRAVLDAMQSVGWKRLPQNPADMTVTIGAGTPKLIVTDESALPFDLLRITIAPDRAAIKAALAEGCQIEGAVLGNPSPHLIVSRR